MSCTKCGRPSYADGTCIGCASQQCTCLAPAKKIPRRKREPTVWERMPIEKRAGTPVDQRFAIPIFGTSKNGKRRHGTVLMNARVYQCGGEIGNFVYWKRHAVTVAMDVWRQILAGVERNGRLYGVDVIEVVDHSRNRVWRIDRDDMLNFGEQYEDSIGPRWGVDLDHGLWELGELPPKKGKPLDPLPPPPSPAAQQTLI